MSLQALRLRLQIFCLFYFLLIDISHIEYANFQPYSLMRTNRFSENLKNNKKNPLEDKLSIDRVNFIFSEH